MNTNNAVTNTVRAAARPILWNIDTSHAGAQFSVRHLMVSNVRGEFRGITGTVLIDELDLSRSKVEVSIDAASVNSGDAGRDAHLKGPDFFDVEAHPKMLFTSTRVRQKSREALEVTGELTIRGITREVVLSVEGVGDPIRDPWGFFRRGAQAYAVVNRKDFGMVWNAALDHGGFAIGDEVKITIDVELTRAASAQVEAASKGSVGVG